MNDLSQLPNLEQIFDELRLGKHICAEDGMVFYQVGDCFDEYKRLFLALGFELERHERGFYYFLGSGDLGKEASEMAVFFFVWIDALGNEGANIREAIFGNAHRVDELPHFKLEMHRQCMSEVEVHEHADLHRILGRLERFGFIKRRNPDIFRFRMPAWRFIDLCYEAAQKDSEISEPQTREIPEEHL